MKTQITISIFYFAVTLGLIGLIGLVFGYLVGFNDGKKERDDED